MKDLKAAAVCMTSPVGEIERNLDRIQSFVSTAAESKVDIICFPELSISGYTLKDPEGVYAPSVTREIIERIEALAGTSGLVILAGLIEIRDKERPYITQIVAGPEGMLGLYRKTHLSPPEKGKYQAGQEIEVFRYRDIVFGVQLCYESHFPEISTLMALKGAQILFIPHASPRGEPKEKRESWLRHLPGRAFDNALFVVACNQVGRTDEGYSFPGVSLALDPAGSCIGSYEGQGENMLEVELSGKTMEEMRTHRMKYFLPNRRPELYGEISSPSSQSKA
ncbi:MAG: nitrilase [Desulfobacterales bacterium]|nr:nitrilase [Desulfobacterales bacterium]